MLPDQTDDEDFDRSGPGDPDLDRIQSVVARMPADVRRAFLLHRGKGMSYTQIATELGVSADLVERYIIDALKRLRQEL